MDTLLQVLPWLVALNAISATACLVLFSLIGRHWVKRRTPLWLTGAGLYSHHFLDGVEYVMNRTALGVSMARSILVFKLMKRNTSTTPICGAPPLPPARPVIPATGFPAGVQIPVAMPKKPQEVVIQAVQQSEQEVSEQTRVRKRAKILPPSGLGLFQ